MFNVITPLRGEWTLLQIMHYTSVKFFDWKSDSVKKMDKYHVWHWSCRFQQQMLFGKSYIFIFYCIYIC